MFTRLQIYLQYLLPQHALSVCIGILANCRARIFKNLFIKSFLAIYNVQLQEAIRQQPEDYNSFNDFFTRQLRPELRPIANEPQAVTSPADGRIAQLGHLEGESLIQAKGHYYTLTKLLAADTDITQHFNNGAYATFYLGPADYHRIHMPISGQLIKTIFVPGQLFSVNRHTANYVPQLYTRNERLICLFETANGMLAVVLVGAMIVGSIQPVWLKAPARSSQIIIQSHAHLRLEKGQELGLFQLGSTVILLFEKHRLQWLPHLCPQTTVRYGECVANLIS